MIFREVARRYLGWCPRFETRFILTRADPLSYSTLAKAMIITFMAAWGIQNTFSYIFIPITLRQNRFYLLDPSTVAYVLILCMRVISGVLLLALLVDYVISKRVLMRHKLELSTLLILQALIWFLGPIAVTPPFSDPLSYLSDWVYPVGLTSLAQSVFLVYLAYRLLRDRSMLGKNSFLLLSIVFITMILTPIALRLLPPTGLRSTVPVTIMLDWGDVEYLALNALLYGIPAAFCLRVYLTLRRRTSFELSLPWYIRGVVVAWSLFQLGVLRLLVTGSLSALNLPSRYSTPVDYLAFAVGTLLYLGLIGASLLPPRLRVGESQLKSPEMNV